VVGPLFFVETIITGNIYLDLLDQFVYSRVDDTERENGTGVVFQQNGNLPHFSLQVPLALNAGFLTQWIQEVDQ
jgi:hypothetical protein